MIDADLYLKAIQFAARAHLGQVVPGSEMPYLTHVTSVAAEVTTCLLTEEDDAIDADLAVLCAVLHDSIEDTEATQETLEEEFGAAVARGVAALTKDASLGSKQAKMADSLERIKQQPKAIWLVKLADRTVNMQPPPKHWSQEKCAAYRDEAKVIAQALGEASPYQVQRLEAKIRDYGQYCA